MDRHRAIDRDLPRHAAGVAMGAAGRNVVVGIVDRVQSADQDGTSHGAVRLRAPRDAVPGRLVDPERLADVTQELTALRLAPLNNTRARSSTESSRDPPLDDRGTHPPPPSPRSGEIAPTAKSAASRPA